MKMFDKKGQHITECWEALEAMKWECRNGQKYPKGYASRQ